MKIEVGGTIEARKSLSELRSKYPSTDFQLKSSDEEAYDVIGVCWYLEASGFTVAWAPRISSRTKGSLPMRVVHYHFTTFRTFKFPKTAVRVIGS